MMTQVQANTPFRSKRKTRRPLVPYPVRGFKLLSNAFSPMTQSERRLSFQRNQSFDVKWSVGVQLKRVQNSSKDDVDYDYMSLVQRLELLRPCVALKQNFRNLEECVT